MFIGVIGGGRCSQKLAKLAEEVGFAKLHVFPFSARNGTAAAKFENQIPEKVKCKRAKRLRGIGTRLRMQFIAENLGKIFEVLAERDETGLTANFIRVKVAGAKENELRKVRLSRGNLALDTFT